MPMGAIAQDREDDRDQHEGAEPEAIRAVTTAASSSIDAEPSAADEEGEVEQLADEPVDELGDEPAHETADDRIDIDREAADERAPEAEAEEAEAEGTQEAPPKRFIERLPPGFFILEGQLFAGFEASPARSYNQFDLRRAEIAMRLNPTEHVGAVIRIEAVRSATPESLLGVDGNSLLVRVKHAYGHAQTQLGPIHGEVRLGMIPDAWIEALERNYDFRGLSPTLSEGGLFFDTSDLGGGLVLSTRGEGFFSKDAIRLSVAATNGEGRNEIERNRGKNVTAALSVQPVVANFLGSDFRVGLHGFYRYGSLGVGAARNDRGGLGFSARHDRFELGGEWIRAMGYLGQSERNASGLGAWLGGSVIDGWLGGALRFDTLNPDRALVDVSRRTITFAALTDFGRKPAEDSPFFGRVRLYVGAQIVTNDELAGPIAGTPEAANETRILVWLASRGGVSLPSASR